MRVKVSGGAEVGPGDRVRFAATAGGARVIDGYVDEITTRRGRALTLRTIVVKDDEGCVYRRAPLDVEKSEAP